MGVEECVLPQPLRRDIIELEAVEESSDDIATVQFCAPSFMDSSGSSTWGSYGSSSHFYSRF